MDLMLCQMSAIPRATKFDWPMAAWGIEALY